MKRNVYKLVDEKGKSVKGLSIRILPSGIVKIFGDSVIQLESIIRFPWGQKKNKIQDEGIKEAIEPVVKESVEIKEPEIKFTPEVNPNEVNIGDRIEIDLAGTLNECKVLQTFDEAQEIKVELKGGVSLVIPASWFVRKI